MSIEVKGITKRYGNQLAVNDVSFNVSGGEIVAFIGPNGAGKTTTMKIITGTLIPDKGEVFINSLPVSTHQKEVKGILGYLPEHNPLYLEMYIREYLVYVAGLYHLKGSGAKEACDRVVEMTGLTREIRKKIGALSKGYRQRVGLAQTLIHDPEILILDEPTTGLDPNQIQEIRKLISAIGEKKTVLLSTHILQEVEAICNRVIIIHEGVLVANESADELKRSRKTHTRTIHVELESPVDPEQWKKLSCIEHVRSLKENQYLLETSIPQDVRAEIFKFAVDQGFTILSLSLQKKSLEEVFREITGN